MKAKTKLFASEESRFCLLTGLKVMGIAFIAIFFVVFVVLTVLKVDLLFFKSLGLYGHDDLKSAYYQFVFERSIDILPYLFIFFIFLFFAGTYLGKLLLRPFRCIAEYCYEAVDNPNAIYSPDQFSDFKLLTRFSEYFFIVIKEKRKEGSLSLVTIPPQFNKIHAPVIDKVFFFHFSLFLSIICLIAAFFLYRLSEDIQEQIMTLAFKTIEAKEGELGIFLKEQSEVLISVLWIGIVILISSYSVLAWSLYGKVSIAAFGVFSTMRAFLKGDYNARVRLIGLRYIRNYSRSMNKYLDFIQKSYGGS